MPERLFRQPWQQDELISRWMAGEKAELIAMKLGVCLSTVGRWRRELRLPKRYHRNAPHQGISKANAYRAIRLWEQGKDTFDIAKKLRISEASVYNALYYYRQRARLFDLAEAIPPTPRQRAGSPVRLCVGEPA